MAHEFNDNLRLQWQNPKDILSVLMIVGADVIGIALAQFTGSSFKPVAFSFGWVAYAYTFLLKTAGRLKLEPDADFKHVLVNCHSGVIHENPNWVLGRIINHYDLWKSNTIDEAIAQRAQEMLAKYDHLPPASRPTYLTNNYLRKSGLVIAVYVPSERRKWQIDKVILTGLGTTISQLGIASIPWGLYGQWHIFLLTGIGSLLAWSMGALQQSSMSARKDANKIFALTRGNGSQHVILIEGNGLGLNLDDIASDAFSSRISSSKHNFMTATALCMVLLWTALLITTSGMQSSTWYLLAIGGVGMLQNIYVAGARRWPEAYGMPLSFREAITRVKVMDTLFEVEDRYPGAGASLLPIFFPGELRADERTRWEGYKSSENTRRQEKRISNMGGTV